jgi:hypothetical protein
MNGAVHRLRSCAHKNPVDRLRDCGVTVISDVAGAHPEAGDHGADA